MLTELRRHVPEAVTTVEAAFEDLPVVPAYDLVFATVSAYLELPESVREQAFGRILQALPAHVALVADLTVHLARRVP